MRTKPILKSVFCILVNFALVFSCFAEIVVIVHPQNNALLDTASVKRIFLGKEKSFPGGAKVLAINQTASSEARAKFDSTVLGRNTTQVSAYWSKLVFTGKGIPPKEVTGDAEVISTVSRNVDAIGYVDSSAVTNDVKSIPLN